MFYDDKSEQSNGHLISGEEIADNLNDIDAYRALNSRMYSHKNMKKPQMRKPNSNV